MVQGSSITTSFSLPLLNVGTLELVSGVLSTLNITNQGTMAAAVAISPTRR
jgi:hypothetical protein